MTEDPDGVTRKKVVKVVKRVARRVEPVDEHTAATSKTSALCQTPTEPPKFASEPPKPSTMSMIPQSAPEPSKPMPASVPKVTKMPIFSFKHDSVKKEEKDDIFNGLASLLTRGRTRELRPRPCKEVSAEKQEPKKEENTEGQKSSAATGKSVQKPEASQSMHSKPEEKTLASSPPTSPATSPPVKSPITPPAGFIPAPKRVPVPKPSHMVPQPGFIPKATEVIKTPTVSAPPTSIPDPKPVPIVPKPAPVTSKVPPVLTPVKSTINSCPEPLATSPGFTPTPKELATKILKVLLAFLLHEALYHRWTACENLGN